MKDNCFDRFLIKIKISVKDKILDLDVRGHAILPKGNTEQINEICAAVTALTNTFVQSVSLLCKLDPVSYSSKSGLLHVKWSAGFLGEIKVLRKFRRKAEQQRHTLLILIRSLQIGLENCKRINEKEVSCEYNLDFV